MLCQWGCSGVKTVIYLDELLLTNFAVAAALLMSAGLFSGRPCTAARLCIGSALAALTSLALLAPELPLLAALAYKAASGAAVIAAAYGLPGRRSFLRLCGWYLLFNLLLCGAVVLPGVQANNLSVFLPLSPGRLLLCCGAVYAGAQGFLYCFGHSAPRQSTPAVLELADGTRLAVQAFYDTGFSVQEPLSGRCVVLVQYRPVRVVLPTPLRSYLDAYFSGNGALPAPELKLRLVPCRTVAGHCVLPAVPANSLSFSGGSIQGLWAAFCDTAASDGEWTLLYGTDTAQQLQPAPRPHTPP